MRRSRIDSDNLLFAQNALAWLTPLEVKSEGCSKEITILAWDGTFAKIARMERVREFIERRGWVLQMARPETFETDLECAEVLWYLSDWDPPAEFADWHVPLIEDFVRRGGGLLVGGLGWSYAQQGGPGGRPRPPPMPPMCSGSRLASRSLVTRSSSKAVKRSRWRLGSSAAT